MMIPLSISHIF